MARCVILYTTFILLIFFRLFICDNIIKTFDTEESIIYDNEIIPGTEEYKSQTVNHDVKETTTDAEEIVTDENVTDEYELKVVCPNFKKSGEFNLERMVGVWRPAYYQVSYKVPCFKMLIRNVTLEEKNHYSQLYGDFNEKVIWDDCNLEIKSSANLVYRKHFLQGCEKGFGILENIIIEQKGDVVPVLIEENADQWLAIKNLLLMKDCISGDTVVFSNEDVHPKFYDIMEALKIFGNTSNGEWVCRDSGPTEKTHAFNGEFESDSDVVFFQ